MIVASEQIASIEPQNRAVLSIKSSQADDPRDLNLKVNSSDPVIVLVFGVATQTTELAPALEVIIGKLTLIDIDYFSDFAKQQDESMASRYDSDSHEVSVKDENARIQRAASILMMHAGVSGQLLRVS
jgi:hypothetical protein